MRAMRVLRLVVHARTREPVLVLGEVDGDRCVPVSLRRPQADVIAIGRRADTDPPLTQDVLLPILAGLGHTLDGVEITELREGKFAADLVFDGGARVPVLPSDALAVAVREGLPIGVADEILDEVGQPVATIFPDGTDAPPEQQLRNFREFLDEVSPEDFGTPGGAGD
jgi:bifunctional DNase/RNase